jgi:hypothetical protein
MICRLLALAGACWIQIGPDEGSGIKELSKLLFIKHTQHFYSKSQLYAISGLITQIGLSLDALSLVHIYVSIS